MHEKRFGPEGWIPSDGDRGGPVGSSHDSQGRTNIFGRFVRNVRDFIRGLEVVGPTSTHTQHTPRQFQDGQDLHEYSHRPPREKLSSLNTIFGEVFLAAGGRKGNITQIAGSETTLISRPAETGEFVSTDFGLVKSLGEEGVGIVLTDPVSSNGVESAKTAEAFISAYRGAMRRGSQVNTEEFFAGFNIARSAVDRVSEESGLPWEEQGFCTAAVLALSPDLFLRGFLVGDMYLYIEGEGFYPNASDTDISSLGAYGESGFAPNSLGGYSTTTPYGTRETEAQFQVELDLSAFKGRKIALCSDALAKVAGIGNGQLPPRGPIQKIENLIQSDNAASAIVASATAIRPGRTTGLDDAVAVSFTI